MPIVVNYYDLNNQTDKESLNSLIYTHYEGDSLSVLPSCEGGCTTGEYNVGLRCRECGTLVLSLTERPIESALWIAPPDGVLTFISPEAWTILSKALSYPGINLLEWLCNPTMIMAADTHKEARKILNALPNLERGINTFFTQFDSIMETLFSANIINGDAQQKADLRQLITVYRDSIFASHLPIPSKLGFITEKTVTGTYHDETMLPAIDAIRTISATVNSPSPLSLRQRMARAVKANMLLSEYYQTFIGTNLSSKPGWFRKHIYGGRLHFTFRAVISSLSDNHDYDELHLPWKMSVLTYKAHLTSKLLKRGFTSKECTRFIHEHVAKYSPLIDELFREMIDESFIDGLPIILNRNPTLMRGSIQALRVTQIKTDLADNSISMSVLCLAAPNADFDGDALNGMVILDERMYHILQAMAPHHGVLDLKKPRTLSGNIKIPAPVVNTISSWVSQEDSLDVSA